MLRKFAFGFPFRSRLARSTASNAVTSIRSAHRVTVAMSGGVDSAVSAFLLKQQGYAVSGVYMRNWDLLDEVGQCTNDADEEDARRVCSHLSIPFETVNFVKDYWNNVFDVSLQGFARGTTPNPDTLCNREIKFH